MSTKATPPSGPPDKTLVVSNLGLTAGQFSSAVSTAIANGYTTVLSTMPSPAQDGSTWLLLGGY
jgi:hypothetical protein